MHQVDLYRLGALTLKTKIALLLVCANEKVFPLLYQCTIFVLFRRACELAQIRDNRINWHLVWFLILYVVHWNSFLSYQSWSFLENFEAIDLLDADVLQLKRKTTRSSFSFFSRTSFSCHSSVNLKSKQPYI